MVRGDLVNVCCWVLSFAVLAREFDGSERWRYGVGCFGWDSYDLAGAVGGSCAPGSWLMLTFWVLCFQVE